ncbi:hypothetical protein [Nocardioides panacisoli]|uniref:Integral membrane protein n=1 Tax=Nocardioides panacisoli TaxID=627624 RepID=A0ABP7IAF4_9ACTN
MAMRSDERAAAETWFALHGLPYFVDGTRAEVARRLTPIRSLPVLLLAAVVGGAAAAAVLATPHPSFAAVAALGGFLLVLGGYALLALHATVIARWAFRRALRSVGLLFPLATRALPILMLFITFLFINTEVWQVASALSAGTVWGAVVFFAVVACLFMVPRLAEELDRFDDQVKADEVLEGTAGTPLDEAARRVVREGVDLPDQAQVTGLQMVNLVLVLVIAQAVQVFLLSVAVFVFFVGFGLLVIDPSVITTWVGSGHPTYPPGPHWVSSELLHVSLFLAGFSGLYFTVVAITDDLYRREFFTSIMDELARAVSMRVVYRMLAADSADPAGSR